MTIDNEIIEAATAWHAVSGHDDMDWEAFTRWLEDNPVHRTAYDQVVLTDALLDDHRNELRAEAAAALAPVGAVGRAARIAWIGGAVAAALVAAVALPMLQQEPAMVYQTDTAIRHIVLRDGSAVDLSPRSRLVIDGKRQDQMALTGGAYFDIRHDPDRQLVVTAGPVQIRDIGTRFDVQSIGSAVRIDVAEGNLDVTSDKFDRSIALAAGHALHFDASGNLARLEVVSPQAVGEWRQGHLRYDNVPLRLVVADLDRYAGVRVSVPAALQARSFSGSLVVSNGHAAARDLAQLMGLALHPADGGYVLDAAGK